MYILTLFFLTKLRSYVIFRYKMILNVDKIFNLYAHKAPVTIAFTRNK